MRRRERTIEQTIEHPIRRRWIEALWNSSEPLSAPGFQAEYVRDDSVTLSTVAFHVRVLVAEGIVELDRAEPTGRGASEFFYVLGGPKSGEALRRLQPTTA
jgi:DNA-binding transcriptional ArsR family regulator